MGIESLQSSIKAKDKETDALYTEIGELESEMDQVLEAERQLKQLAGKPC